MHRFRVIPDDEIEIQQKRIGDGLVIVFLPVDGLREHPQKGSRDAAVRAGVKHNVIIRFLGIDIVQKERTEKIRRVQERVKHGVQGILPEHDVDDNRIVEYRDGVSNPGGNHAEITGAHLKSTAGDRLRAFSVIDVADLKESMTVFNGRRISFVLLYNNAVIIGQIKKEGILKYIRDGLGFFIDEKVLFLHHLHIQILQKCLQGVFVFSRNVIISVKILNSGHIVDMLSCRGYVHSIFPFDEKI